MHDLYIQRVPSNSQTIFNGHYNTWLKDNPALLEYVSVPGCTAVFRNRELSKGGGVGAYIHESINFKRRIDIEKRSPDLEHLWLEVPGRSRHSKVLIGIMYRSTRILSDTDWLERMDALLGNITANWDGLLVVTGDVNVDMLKPSNILTQKYQAMLDVFGLHQMVSKPTRVTRTSKALLDHIVTNYPRTFTFTDVIPCSTVADHDAPFACINVRIPRFKPRFKCIRNEKNLSECAFQEDFFSLPLLIVLPH